MNKKAKRLTLNKETLRNLEERVLQKAAGGTTEVGSQCPTGGCNLTCARCSALCTGNC